MEDKKKDKTKDAPASTEVVAAPKIPNFFDIMEGGEASEFAQVLNSFYTSDENMELKTELHNPRALAILDVYINYIAELGFKRQANRWKIFRKTYLNAMVSYKRGGRKELVEMVQEFKEELKEKEVAWD